MRKVKYKSNINIRSNISLFLTEDKVYDVVELGDDYFKIIDDQGMEFGIMVSNNLFIDVTSEYRSELIDEILA